MATEKQYLFFKSLYDEENARQTSLQDRAKTYLSLITFYSAFVLFVVEKLRPTTPWPKAIFFATIVAALLAFLLSLLTLRVSEYESLEDPQDIIDGFDQTPPSDEDFFDDRIVDYTVAYKRNSEVNDKKADLLVWAGYFILVGLFFHACYIAIMIAF